MRSGLGSILLLALLWAPGGAARAEGPAAAVFEQGALEAGILAGYGWGFGAFGSDGTDNEDADYVNVAPRLGVQLTDPFGGDAWWRGNVELLLEGTLLVSRNPNNGFGGGAALVARYNFLGAGRVVPFVEASGGLIDLDFDLSQQRDGFNFTLHGGAGMHLFLTPNVALTGQYRYQHISNADTRTPNDGIDTHQALGGVTLFFGWDRSPAERSRARR